MDFTFYRITWFHKDTHRIVRVLNHIGIHNAKHAERTYGNASLYSVLEHIKPRV